MSSPTLTSKFKSYVFAILTFGWLLNLLFSKKDPEIEAPPLREDPSELKFDYVVVFKYEKKSDYIWTQEIRNYLKNYLVRIGMVVEEKIIVQVKQGKQLVNKVLADNSKNPFKTFQSHKIEQVFIFYLLEPTTEMLEKEMRHNTSLSKKKSLKRDDVTKDVETLNSSERQRFIFSVLNRKIIAQSEDKIFFKQFNDKIENYNRNFDIKAEINQLKNKNKPKKSSKGKKEEEKTENVTSTYLQNIKYYTSERILPKLTYLKYIDSVYPTHNEEERKKLFKEYSAGFYHQPLEGMRTYFGEKIGFYFAWLNIYTRALFIPSIIVSLIYIFYEIAYLINYSGFIIEVTTDYLTIFYCVLLCIWSTFFLEIWKRRSAVLAWKWGVNGYQEHEEQRPQFIGEIIDHPYRIGCQYKIYPSFKRYLKIFCISLPVMLGTLIFSAFLMVLCFQIEDFILSNFAADSYFHHLPVILICLEIYVMNFIYSKFALRLNNWENYETDADFNKHFVWKRILFEFLNAYASFFYIAFFKRDMARLQTQLIGVFVSRQIFQNITECLVPWLQLKFKEKMMSRKRGVETLADKLIDEYELSPYDDTYDDYAEMVIQYGYLLQFSAAFPLASLFSVINNIIELRSDAFKLIFTQRRSNSKKIDGIGIWQPILEFISVVAVVTNCCLLLFTTNQLDIIFSYYNQYDVRWKLFAVILLEHFILIFKWLLSEVIPDIPNHIKFLISKDQYLEKLKLKEMKNRLKDFNLDTDLSNPNLFSSLLKKNK